MDSASHGFRFVNHGKRHFAKEKGIETVALVRVLKKEGLDSLGADTKYQKCKILTVMAVINRTQTSVQY